jgi:hypothetical protein
VVVQNKEQKVLLGKHADGPFKGKWGIPSLSSEHERRPQICAAQLVECSSMGILGKASALVKECKQLGKTVNGMIVYSLTTSCDSLDSILTNCSSYLKRCFPANGIPKGVVAWEKCEWVSLTETKTLDKFTQDAFQFLSIYPIR